jgi:DNA-binding NarL/FixJ family response regulator
VTKRQKQVANLLMRAYSNPEIAEELGLAHRTVKRYMNDLFNLFQIHEDGRIKRIVLAMKLYEMGYRGGY